MDTFRHTAGEKEHLVWLDRQGKGVPMGKAIQRAFIQLRDICSLDYQFPFEK